MSEIASLALPQKSSQIYQILFSRWVIIPTSLSEGEAG